MEKAERSEGLLSVEAEKEIGVQFQGEGDGFHDEITQVSQRRHVRQDLIQSIQIGNTGVSASSKNQETSTQTLNPKSEILNPNP